MSSTTDESGQTLAGSYYLRRRVARGGRGVVYLADDLFSSRPVALKVSRRSGTKAVAELVREAAFLTAVDHVRIPQFYEVGALPDGRAFLALEWVNGVSLEALVLETPIALSTALDAAAALADVLVALHAHRILHRDVKPLNVLVPTQPASRVLDLKITDFGIASEMHDVTEHGRPSTDFGRQAGTPIYMAPEQLAGRRQTPATDVFGLGATLFFMLFRQPPMGDGEIPRAALSLPDAPKIMMGPFVIRRLTEEVVLPTEPEYPESVRELLTLMLRRDPAARLQTALEARDSLRDVRRAVTDCSLESTSGESSLASGG